ncbi:MAG: Smr/MutS family protein [Desulfomonilia bacterium]
MKKMMKDKHSTRSPFSKLKDITIRKEPTPRSRPKVTLPSKEDHPEENDRALFLTAMKGVKPMESDIVLPEPIEQSTVVDHVQERLRKQDIEAREALEALVQGKATFDITSTGEYVEGHVISLDPRIMKKLKDGEFTIQAHLDLHGYIREDAHKALISFIRNSHALGRRALLVIHGRGLKSDHGPVLKESVISWLTHGELSHLVLAFSSSRPCDGGTGAIYVLLKKHPKKSKWKRPL